MRFYKTLASILLISLLLTGCVSSGKDDSEYAKKEVVIKGYLSELFKLDKELIKKYELETPLPVEYDPPYLYVDQRYIKDIPRIRKYIAEDALVGPDSYDPNTTIPYGVGIETPSGNVVVDPDFVIPYGMVLKRDNGTVIGKVVDIKRVKKVLIRGDVYPPEFNHYPTDVTTIVKLDSGKEAEVVFNIDVQLTKQSSKFMVRRALFSPAPWGVWTSFFTLEGPVRTKIKD